MGFYLRKSFKLGPMRINVSKGGLGASFGVTGARVGVSPTGRAYVHAGRGGLYIRESLGSSRQSASTGAAAFDPVVQFVRTEAAFETEQGGSTRLRAIDRRVSNVSFVSLAGIGVLTMMVGGGLVGWVGWAVGAVLAGAGLFLWYQGARSNRDAQRLRGALYELVRAGVWDDQRWAVVSNLLQEGWRIPEETKGLELEGAFLEACRLVVEDGRVDDKELDLLARLEEFMGGPSEFTEAAKVDAFRGLYFTAIADQDLSLDEEKVIAHVQQRLGVRPQDIEAELRALVDLRELRAVRGGELPVLEASVPLQRGEVCHFEGVGRLLKEKQLSGYQQQGQRYKVRGLVVDKEGNLLITNKRILLIHDGTSSIQHSKILDLEVDVDENIIRITKDGVSKPTILSTPDTLRAAALLANLTGA